MQIKGSLRAPSCSLENVTYTLVRVHILCLHTFVLVHVYKEAATVELASVVTKRQVRDFQIYFHSFEFLSLRGNFEEKVNPFFFAYFFLSKEIMMMMSGLSWGAHHTHIHHLYSDTHSQLPCHMCDLPCTESNHWSSEGEVTSSYTCKLVVAGRSRGSKQFCLTSKYLLIPLLQELDFWGKQEILCFSICWVKFPLFFSLGALYWSPVRTNSICSHRDARLKQWKNLFSLQFSRQIQFPYTNPPRQLTESSLLLF